MQNENKPQHWKEKLADTKALSADTGMNKEVAWETLSHRLQKRAKRRKAILYWVSVACLLPLLLLVPFFYQQDQSNIIKPVVHAYTSKKPMPVNSEPVHNEMVIAKPDKPYIKTTASSKKRETNTIAAIEKEKPLIVQNRDSVLQSNEATILINNDSSAINITAVAQPKKKLRVVHINELNEPQEATPVMAHNFLPRFFPLHIAATEVETTSLPTIHRTSFISLKTKPSSN